MGMACGTCGRQQMHTDCDWETWRNAW